MTTAIANKSRLPLQEAQRVIEDFLATTPFSRFCQAFNVPKIRTVALVSLLPLTACSTPGEVQYLALHPVMKALTFLGGSVQQCTQPPGEPPVCGPEMVRLAPGYQAPPLVGVQPVYVPPPVYVPNAFGTGPGVVYQPPAYQGRPYITSP